MTGDYVVGQVAYGGAGGNGVTGNIGGGGWAGDMWPTWPYYPAMPYPVYTAPVYCYPMAPALDHVRLAEELHRLMERAKGVLAKRRDLDVIRGKNMAGGATKEDVDVLLAHIDALEGVKE